MNQPPTYNEFPVQLVLDGARPSAIDEAGSRLPATYGPACGGYCAGAVRAVLLGGIVCLGTMTVNGQVVQSPLLGGTTYLASRRETAPDAVTLQAMVPTLSRQVASIVDSFSLTITQVARVLGVSRPTVYSWKRSNDLPSAEDPKHQRLLAVFKLARAWEALGSGPLGDRNLVPFEDDQRCILDHLTRENLDAPIVALIRERLERLASHGSPSADTAPGHADWREGFRKQGFEASTPEEQEETLESNLRRLRHED